MKREHLEICYNGLPLNVGPVSKTRHTPTRFYTCPWCGSSQTVFETCPCGGAEGYHAGVIGLAVIAGIGIVLLALAVYFVIG